MEDLEEHVGVTRHLIQDEETPIANSKQETEALTTWLRLELVDLSTLSRQIVVGEDRHDKAVIAEVDRIRVEAIRTVDVFLR